MASYIWRMPSHIYGQASGEQGTSSGNRIAQALDRGKRCVNSDLSPTEPRRTLMTIKNALASVAVKDVNAAAKWYEQVLSRPASMPMPEVAEWTFERGGGLQVYQLPERSGSGSCTLIVSDIENLAAHLGTLGIDTSEKTSSERVKTVMITDPDGNHIAFAEPMDPGLAQ
jgi:hypothetical protein